MRCLDCSVGVCVREVPKSRKTVTAAWQFAATDTVYFHGSKKAKLTKRKEVLG